MGLAPATDEELGTIPPYDWGGNMDCKHITEAAATDTLRRETGRCGGTAIETPMTARLRFTLEKNKPWVRSPHYCTKQGAQSYADRGQEYAVMGLDQDLREATRKALRSAIEWLGAEKGLDRSEAYMLCSVAGDLKIVQAVDMPHYGVLYIYPVKALCGIRLDNSEVGGQGLQYDRTFMIGRVEPNGDLIKIQGSKTAECALFQQRIVNYSLRISYNRPEAPLVAYDKIQDTELEFPLEPETDNLERAEINLHQSLVSAYRMGAKYDDWFTACFGFKTALLYIGQERRPVLATCPGTAGRGGPEVDWLTFSDCAPLLVTTEASLRNVCTRVASGQVDMLKFRPNIVVDGAQEWDEDFWAALSLNGKPAVLLTKLCNRCTSLNIDYRTGRFGTGEQGQILKLLMKDRRVDEGFKYAPVFGRYGFLDNGVEGLSISVGDEMVVTKRTEERPSWDWPMNARKEEGRYYRY
ncbi:hypothetical protein NQ176_g7642 [Zarea fungicola]|uniref:Uncharacterized protein n=1 Tax=Zarea fungicola TaxID=93591 RepID=A0ACC1MZ77_9HYPO|nr:hypothetical protein NQ176_g7642 [Lecanicillium fungicola]